MRTKDCRIMLDRHKLEYARLWMTRCPGVFDFVENNGAQVKSNISGYPRKGKSKCQNY